MLDQVEKRLLAPLDVVEHRDERPLGRSVLQRLAERPRDVLRRRWRLALAEQRADRRGGGLLDGQQVELLQHLDHRPVRDPLAVGKAAATDDRRLDRGQKLRREPRLADAGIADDRDQLATLLGPHALPSNLQDRELALTADEQRPMPPLRRVTYAEEPVGGNRLGLALQLQRLDRFDLGRVADERERRLSDQHLARLRSLLQPRRDVHRITRRQPLLRARHHLARDRRRSAPAVRARAARRASRPPPAPHGARRPRAPPARRTPPSPHRR